MKPAKDEIRAVLGILIEGLDGDEVKARRAMTSAKVYLTACEWEYEVPTNTDQITPAELTWDESDIPTITRMR